LLRRRQPGIRCPQPHRVAGDLRHDAGNLCRVAGNLPRVAGILPCIAGNPRRVGGNPRCIAGDGWKAANLNLKLQAPDKSQMTNRKGGVRKRGAAARGRPEDRLFLKLEICPLGASLELGA
jgi:hypothetical protein